MESAIFEVVKACLIARYHVSAGQISWQSVVLADLGFNLAERKADREKEFQVSGDRGALSSHRRATGQFYRY